MSDMSDLAVAYVSVRAKMDKMSGDLASIKGQILDTIGGWKSAVNKAMGGLFAGFAAMGTGHIMSAAIQDSDALARLEAVVTSTGHAAGLTAQQISDWSSAMQKSTRFADEVTNANAAMMLTFKSVKGEQFFQAMEMAMNLASTGMASFEGAVIQLGKALEDPERGLMALRRSGVSFSEEERKTIKGLYDMGKVAEGQTMILKIMADQGLGGVARAMAKTFGGQLTQMKNNVGDMAEVLGRVLFPIMTPIVQGFSQMAVAFQSIEGPVKAVTTTIGEGISEAFAKLKEPLQHVMQSLQGVVKHFGDLGAVMGGAAFESFQGFVDAMASGFEGLAQWISQNTAELAAFIAIGAGVVGIVVAVKALALAFAGLGAIVAALTSPIGLVVLGIAALVGAAANLGIEWSQAFTVFKTAIANLPLTWEIMKTGANAAFMEIKERLVWAAENWKAIMVGFGAGIIGSMDWVVQEFPKRLALLGKQISDFANAGIEKFKDLFLASINPSGLFVGPGAAAFQVRKADIDKLLAKGGQAHQELPPQNVAEAAIRAFDKAFAAAGGKEFEQSDELQKVIGNLGNLLEQFKDKMDPTRKGFFDIARQGLELQGPLKGVGVKPTPYENDRKSTVKTMALDELHKSIQNALKGGDPAINQRNKMIDEMKALNIGNKNILDELKKQNVRIVARPLVAGEAKFAK